MQQVGAGYYSPAPIRLVTVLLAEKVTDGERKYAGRQSFMAFFV